LAVYVGPESDGIYPADTLEFLCEDGVTGMFTIDQIKALSQHQGSLTDQLNELYRIATKLKMYDAADWLERRWVDLPS
jgi:hypothetical protein